MTWARQVVHIALKDVRMARWYLAGYCGALVLSAIAAFDHLPTPGFLLPAIVLLMMIINTSLVVQEDSPYRADAFWPTKPLQPSAVFGGKALFVAVALAAIGCVAQSFVIWFGYAASSTEVVKLSLKSLVGTLAFLLPTIMIAVVTRDLTSVLLAWLALIVAGNFAGWGVELAKSTGILFHLPRLLFVALDFASTALSVFIVVWVYRTRNRRLGAILVTAALFVLPSLIETVRALAKVETSVPAAAAPTALRGTSVTAGGDWGAVNEEKAYLLWVRLAGRIDDRLAYRLEQVFLDIRLQDGTSFRVAAKGSAEFGAPPPPALAGVEWLKPDSAPRGWDAPREEMRHSLQVLLTARQRRLLENPIGLIVVHGQMHVFERRVRPAVPLVAGTTIVSRGHRLRIMSIDSVAGSAQIAMSLASVDRSLPVQFSDFNRLPEYALVNRGRGQAIILNRGGASGYGGMGPVTIVGDFRRTTADFSTTDRGRSVLPYDRAWLADADLLRFLWLDRGTYPITITCGDCK